MKQFYRLHDSDKKIKDRDGSVLLKNHKDAIAWNSNGWGIFWAVNDFKNGIRRYVNLEKINAWFIEIDDGTKEEMVTRAQRGLTPSALIETKKGLQLYWYCKDDLFKDKDRESVIDDYKKVLKFRLLPFYGGDNRACDACRILRVPNFYHLKNLNDPFLIKCHYENENRYTYEQMKMGFPEIIPEIKTVRKKEFKVSGDDFWDKVVNIDCEQGLLRISGQSFVNGEYFEIRYSFAGKKIIYVNSKPTSCWIDGSGMIGSTDGGGPTLANWIYWYLKDWKQVADSLRSVFPELS